jgi:murein tripeptide amidase MpaA
MPSDRNRSAHIPLQVSGNFDNGNIEFIESDANDVARLRIRADCNSRNRQWFCFRVVGTPNLPHTFKLVNAGECDSPDSWKDFRAVASYDRQHWFRVPTTFDGDTLTISFTPAYPITYYAQFAPYQQHHFDDMLVKAQQVPGVSVATIGRSLDGRPIDMLRIRRLEGDVQADANAARSAFWITARQHPGEPMSAWCMEGFIERLLDADDRAAALVRAAGDLFIMPNMNPDGSFHGHTRTNAAGANLNRIWLNPQPDESPEVCAVIDAMVDTGVDFYLDIHGDKELPYVFPVRSDGIPSITARQIKLRERFEAELLHAAVGFQTEHAYPPDKPGGADLNIAANYVAERFGCFAITIEQPFSDDANHPDPEVGWSPQRAKELGAALVGALAAIAGDVSDGSHGGCAISSTSPQVSVC